MPINRELLVKPFERGQVRQRQGPGKTQLDYVSGADVIRRLLDATDNHYSWNVEKVELMPLGTGTMWLVYGTLTLEGLGYRSGVGTHPADSVEAAKAAETDALKRAAVKFGIALHLYEDDAPRGRMAAPVTARRNGVASDRSISPSNGRYESAPVSTRNGHGTPMQGRTAHQGDPESEETRCRYCNAPPGGAHATRCPAREATGQEASASQETPTK